MADRDARPIAVTMGDPAGIGPEIVVKVAAERTDDDAPIMAVGDAGALRRAAARAGVTLDVRPVDRPDAARGGLAGGWLPVLEAGSPLPPDLTLGRVSAVAGSAAFSYLNRAIDLALDGSVRAIVTAPLHKEALAMAGVRQPGHTEILAERAGGAEVAMMLANDELRVLLVSIHVPLAEAIHLVSPEREFRAIVLAHEACRSFGVERPRVAVAGLNPHAGEGGMFGSQDRDVIEPAVRRARTVGIDATGPWAADTIFMRARRGEFDVVVAQYHDQGLIPVKYLGIDQGVNITVGLPFVRTSVDHGTAFDIAGTGRADHASLAYAIRIAEAMSARVPEPVA